jgi:hypothetical protein
MEVSADACAAACWLVVLGVQVSLIEEQEVTADDELKDLLEHIGFKDLLGASN